jgi:hypothetical protein
MIESTNEGERRREGLLPRGVLIAASFLGAVVVATLAILGPLVLGTIHYPTSQSGTWQTMGVDAVNLIIMVPVLVIGGLLLLLRRDGAKYFLILAPVTLFSLALEAGAGQEWSLYPGNAERFVWLYIVEIIVALVLTVGVLPMFSERDAPSFNRRGLRIYVAFVTLLLALFTVMWLQELVQVATTGNTASGSYQNSPVAFWMVRFMDLGVTIPLGFLGMYLLLTKPAKAYALVLLFFGFFVTMGTSVTAMGLVMFLNHDPEAQVGALVIFPMLTVMAWAGLLYLVKEKLPWSRRTRETRRRPARGAEAK